MPNTKKQIRFRMDTETFITIWVNHCAHPGADDWKNFVLNCFERFTEASEAYNMDQLFAHEPLWDSAWNPDARYEFLSERCYAKCMTIRSKLMKDKGYEPVLPQGYKTRNGSKAPKRITSERMYDLFSMKG